MTLNANIFEKRGELHSIGYPDSERKFFLRFSGLLKRFFVVFSGSTIGDNWSLRKTGVMVQDNDIYCIYNMPRMSDCFVITLLREVEALTFYPELTIWIKKNLDCHKFGYAILNEFAVPSINFIAGGFLSEFDLAGINLQSIRLGVIHIPIGDIFDEVLNFLETS